jgi:ribosomal protein L37AE/L43A
MFGLTPRAAPDADTPPWRVLVERRTALGVTQRLLAQEAGVSRGSLGLLECGLGGSEGLRAAVERALTRLERMGAVRPPPPVCAHPDCGAAYVRRSGTQVYCSPKCGERARKQGLARPAVVVSAEHAAAQVRHVEEVLRAARAQAAPARSGLPVAPGREAGWFVATAPAQPLAVCELCGGHYRGAPAWRFGHVEACAVHDAWDVARWCAAHPAAVAGVGR